MNRAISVGMFELASKKMVNNGIIIIVKVIFSTILKGYLGDICRWINTCMTYNKKLQ